MSQATCWKIPGVLLINSHPPCAFRFSSGTTLTAVVYAVILRWPHERPLHSLGAAHLKWTIAWKWSVQGSMFTLLFCCLCSQNTLLNWCRVFQKHPVCHRRTRHSHFVSFNDLSTCITIAPWNGAFLGKFKGDQLVKKLSSVHGYRKFITVFTRACHLSLSWTRLIDRVHAIFL
jgi:hypothetical protein